MIENQSDNIDDKEIDTSNEVNSPEDVSSTEDQITENDELSPQKTEEINTEDLKNSISFHLFSSFRNLIFLSKP